ncbi:MAG TPA: zinc ABC transporter substrate-binding protein [Solirubrobacteraceae bacterium]|jgi:zinc/manganese transport system substrate-binding protein|nr:zinc ABC transporter substrate-binding protein [Solirubrobacteraceae bacterium]
MALVVLALPLAIGVLSVAALLGGCGEGGAGVGGGAGKLEVVAAENFWGSIAAQLGGAQVEVRSIITNPDTDPHSYEPTAADARTLAGARLAIVNGVGYDEWASRLLAASPSEGRVVLNVGALLGLKDGDNPHRWYFPSNVFAVLDAIVADYDRLDPAGAAYFARQKQAFLTRGLARYDELRREIRARYAGVPVGYSESISCTKRPGGAPRRARDLERCRSGRRRGRVRGDPRPERRGQVDAAAGAARLATALRGDGECVGRRTGGAQR